MGHHNYCRRRKSKRRSMDLLDLLDLPHLLPHQTSAVHAIRLPATKKKTTEPALPLCLFLPFSCLQSLPAFCSMFSIILTLTECRHISTVCCFVFLKHNFKLSDIETFLSINLKEGDYKIFSS